MESNKSQPNANGKIIGSEESLFKPKFGFLKEKNSYLSTQDLSRISKSHTTNPESKVSPSFNTKEAKNNSVGKKDQKHNSKGITPTKNILLPAENSKLCMNCINYVESIKSLVEDNDFYRERNTRLEERLTDVINDHNKLVELFLDPETNLI
ncbi:hypothetical protein BB560_001276 [Smittium megazygosporum]|uniref:Uncharacterized protein n=1 Tax=Smittium megazygosporum TaxID=133381 RepID=A0A2T9ZI25_9FUNG|nr:hypothetical protein BB560_001276 [Smittium megazygosporum]